MLCMFTLFGWPAVAGARQLFLHESEAGHPDAHKSIKRRRSSGPPDERGEGQSYDADDEDAPTPQRARRVSMPDAVLML